MSEKLTADQEAQRRKRALVELLSLSSSDRRRIMGQVRDALRDVRSNPEAPDAL